MEGFWLVSGACSRVSGAVQHSPRCIADICLCAFGGNLPETGRPTKYCVVQILRSLFLGSAF